MLFDDADIDALVDGLGDAEVALFGGAELPVIFRSDRQVRLINDELATMPPHAIASKARCEALGIEAGNDGDTLEIRGVDYTVLAIDANSAGTVTLTLEAA